MINVNNIQSFWESNKHQPEIFENKLRHLMGLCDESGNDYKDSAGNRVLRESQAQIKPEQFNIKDLAEAMLGRGAKIFEPLNGSELHRIRRASEGKSREELRESGGGFVDPSAFNGVTSYNYIVSHGLLESRVLKSFQAPKFIANKLAPVVASKTNGGKTIQYSLSRGATSHLSIRQPGESHPTLNAQGRYVVTPPTRELAYAIHITREAVLFDHTNELLKEAAAIGDMLAYQKELNILEVIVGAMNGASYFNWDGTAYQYYQDASATLGFNSVLTGNALVDWTSIQAAWLQLSRNTDPTKTTRIGVTPNVLLCGPGLYGTASQILDGKTSQRRTAGSNTQATASTLNVSNADVNPVSYFGQFELVTSPYVEQAMVNPMTNGSAQVAANNAASVPYWWLIDTNTAFEYQQNIPLTLESATTDSWTMKDKGLIQSLFVHERGNTGVMMPWSMIRCTS